MHIVREGKARGTTQIRKDKTMKRNAITKAMVAKAWANAMMADYNASVCNGQDKAELDELAATLRADGSRLRYAYAKQQGIPEHEVRRSIHPKAEAIFLKMRGF